MTLFQFLVMLAFGPIICWLLIDNDSEEAPCELDAYPIRTVA